MTYKIAGHVEPLRPFDDSQVQVGCEVPEHVLSLWDNFSSHRWGVLNHRVILSVVCRQVLVVVIGSVAEGSWVRPACAGWRRGKDDTTTSHCVQSSTESEEDSSSDRADQIVPHSPCCLCIRPLSFSGLQIVRLKQRLGLVSIRPGVECRWLFQGISCKMRTHVKSNQLAGEKGVATKASFEM